MAIANVVQHDSNSALINEDKLSESSASDLCKGQLEAKINKKKSHYLFLSHRPQTITLFSNIHYLHVKLTLKCPYKTPVIKTEYRKKVISLRFTFKASVGDGF